MNKATIIKPSGIVDRTDAVIQNRTNDTLWSDTVATWSDTNVMWSVEHFSPSATSPSGNIENIKSKVIINTIKP